MFWLFLLLRPRYRRRYHVRAHRKHARFCSVWYWLSGLALMELMLWVAVFEIAGELLAVWWLLWWGYRAMVMAAGRYYSVRGGAYRLIDTARPVWPKTA